MSEERQINWPHWRQITWGLEQHYLYVCDHAIAHGNIHPVGDCDGCCSRSDYPPQFNAPLRMTNRELERHLLGFALAMKLANDHDEGLHFHPEDRGNGYKPVSIDEGAAP